MMQQNQGGGLYADIWEETFLSLKITSSTFREGTLVGEESGEVFTMDGQRSLSKRAGGIYLFIECCPPPKITIEDNVLINNHGYDTSELYLDCVYNCKTDEVWVNTFKLLDSLIIHNDTPPAANGVWISNCASNTMSVENVTMSFSNLTVGFLVEYAEPSIDDSRFEGGVNVQSVVILH